MANVRNHFSYSDSDQISNNLGKSVGYFILLTSIMASALPTITTDHGTGP